MRPDERDPAYLWDMLEAARAIVSYTEGLALEDFLADVRQMQLTRLAVERLLGILGEAARGVSSHLRDEHPEIPWKDIIGLRNVISHEYRRVNYEGIHEIVRADVPQLIVLLEPLIPPLPPLEE